MGVCVGVCVRVIIFVFKGFFSEEGSKLQDAFKKAADKERDNFKFIFTSNADVLKEYGYDE